MARPGVTENKHVNNNAFQPCTCLLLPGCCDVNVRTPVPVKKHLNSAELACNADLCPLEGDRLQL